MDNETSKVEGEGEGEDQDAEQLWLDEAERRLAAYRRGETTSIPGDEVFGELLKQA